MLTPSIGFCGMPSTTSGAGMPVASRIVGTMSMMWWNWLRMPPLSVMRPGHAMAMPWRTPPKCEAICLVQENGVSNAQAHGTAMCGIGLVGAPGVVEILQLVLDRHLDSVEHGHFVRRAEQCAFGTGAIVAVDVDDQRVVELAHVVDCLDHAADFVVGVGDVGGEDIDLAEEHLLFVGRELVPMLQQVMRPRRQLGILAGSRPAFSGWRRSARAARSSPCRTGACR